jgi:hypothetical protein
MFSFFESMLEFGISMALLTLPLGLDQQEGWGTVPLPSAMRTFFHGLFSLIPAYREAYAQ